MKLHQLFILAVFGLAVVAPVGPVVAQRDSQAAGCADVDWPALHPSDPGYSEAVDLAQALADHGFVVKCIAPSKMTGMFEAQQGAALFRTNAGSFDALFLFRPLTFDELQIVERQENGRYLYAFGGRPLPWLANRFDASRPVHFVKHANLLIVANDKELAAHLTATLAGL